jgi:hypothetical protein
VTVSEASQATVSTSQLIPHSASSRLFFIDNVRVFVILWTILHHAANPYGGTDFWYVELPTAMGRNTLLSWFLTLSASFSMATLLLFSGYLVPSSYDRRSFWAYHQEKFVRLGIPLLIGFFIYIPLLMYWYHITARGSSDSFWEYYRNVWFGTGPRPDPWKGPWPDRHLSHLWYIEHLFTYSVAYGIIRYLFFKPGKSISRPGRTPGWLTIELFAIGLTLVTFLVRVKFPLNVVINLLGFLQIEMAHYPHWIAFFVVGLLAWRGDWFRQFPERRGMQIFWIGIALTALSFFFTFSAEIAPYFHGPASEGGWTWQSMFKSTWESFFCVHITIGLVAFFRRFINTQRDLGRFLSVNAYSVHIFHQGVIVALHHAMVSLWRAGMAIPVLGQFAIVGGLGIILSNLLSQWVIRKIPFATRVL